MLYIRCILVLKMIKFKFLLNKLFPKTSQNLIPFLYNGISISFEKIKIWIFLSEKTNPALKDQYLMKILKFCVYNIWLSKITLRIEKCQKREDLDLVLHLTMKSWIDEDKNNIHEYSFNAAEVLLSILNNKETPDSVKTKALIFYSQVTTRNIIPLRKLGSNVINLSI